MATTGVVPDTNQNSLVWVPAMTRFLIVLGLAIVVVGLLWPYLARFGLGRLPGDLVFQRDNVTLYVPLMTCLLLSLLFSLILWAVNRGPGARRDPMCLMLRYEFGSERRAMQIELQDRRGAAGHCLLDPGERRRLAGNH
jgi:hypothetical protein